MVQNLDAEWKMNSRCNWLPIELVVTSGYKPDPAEIVDALAVGFAKSSG
jgi:hypothetical protein